MQAPLPKEIYQQKKNKNLRGGLTSNVWPVPASLRAATRGEKIAESLSKPPTAGQQSLPKLAVRRTLSSAGHHQQNHSVLRTHRNRTRNWASRKKRREKLGRVATFFFYFTFLRLCFCFCFLARIVCVSPHPAPGRSNGKQEADLRRSQEWTVRDLYRRVFVLDSESAEETL